MPSPAYQYPFAPNPQWSKYYSPAEEIQVYYEKFATERGYLEKYIHVRHRVDSAVWDETASEWVLTITVTDDESKDVRTFEDRVDFLIANVGVLNTWKWPDIPAREVFKGQITHSADYDTTLDLKDKTVIIIGSGASAIQIVPAIQPIAKKVISFYRTPQWIGPGLAMDGHTDAEGRNFFCKHRYRSFLCSGVANRDYPRHRRAEKAFL